nr:hypothetical protein [Massilia putida]
MVRVRPPAGEPAGRHLGDSRAHGQSERQRVAGLARVRWDPATILRIGDAADLDAHGKLPDFSLFAQPPGLRKHR